MAGEMAWITMTKMHKHLLGSMVQQIPCGTGGHGFNSHGWLSHLMWTLLKYLCSIRPWWEIAVDYFGDKVVGVAVCHKLWELKPLDGCLWIGIGVLCTKSINLCFFFCFKSNNPIFDISRSSNYSSEIYQTIPFSIYLARVITRARYIIFFIFLYISLE